MGNLRSLASRTVLVGLVFCPTMVTAAGVDLLVTRIPIGAEPRACLGCQVVVMSTRDGEVHERVLTPTFAAAREPAVSFDGTGILFSGRRTPDEAWQIWRINRDGTDPKQLTHGPGDCASPRWAGALFHLDDERPTDRIVFVSTAHGWRDEGNGRAHTALYAADADGGDAVRITFNPGSDSGPELLPNGRVVYSSLLRDSRGGVAQALMAVNIDGTDMMSYSGAHSGPPGKHMARVGRDGRLYLIQSEDVGPLAGGDLAVVSMRRPLSGPELLARADGGSYLGPLPLADGGLLASFKARGPGARYTVHRIDPTTGIRLGPLYDVPGFHVIAAAELGPSPRVQGRSSVVDRSRTTGVFYCLSTHHSDRPEIRRIDPDSVRSIRVVEGVPRAAGGVSPGESEHWRRRILGVVPLSGDGSFHIEVPAERPISFDLLDADGLEVARQHSWVWVMPHESRGCIGCHEDRETAPQNLLAEAVVKPAQKLPPVPPGKSR